jgi:hypothetical protein
MSETQKKIKELEQRIRDLEARPVLPQILPMPLPIFIPAPMPIPQPIPWYPPSPFPPYYIGDDPRFPTWIT